MSAIRRLRHKFSSVYSPDELERITPKPTPNLTLDDIVRLTKNGTSPDQIMAEIKASNSAYDLSPSQAVDLSKQSVDAKVQVAQSSGMFHAYSY